MDRLIPSITVTIFFSSEEWDGALSLFEMTDDEIMKFQSSLREAMLFIKYSKDKENLNRVLAV